MKIRGMCNPALPKLCFGDLRIGDVLTFPNNPGWRNHVFLIIWTSEIYGKKYETIDKHTLIRLDGNPSDNNTGMSGDQATAGQSYNLTRHMMDRGVETKGGPDRYVPERHNALLTLEEEY